MGLLDYKTQAQTIVRFCPGSHMGQEPLVHRAGAPCPQLWNKLSTFRQWNISAKKK